MAGARPGAVMIAHDVAVCARGWIVRQVGVPLRVHKRIRTDADGDPRENGGDDDETSGCHESTGSTGVAGCESGRTCQQRVGFDGVPDLIAEALAQPEHTTP